MNHFWPWGLLALLGAYHGLNPSMGWLFALSLGLQDKRRAALFLALIPIALGHATAIAAALVLLRIFQRFLSITIVKVVVAIILFSLGAYRLFRASHPRGAGLRVGPRDLFFWSFLMASAHGAGLMLMPVLMAQPSSAMIHPNMNHSMTHINAVNPLVLPVTVLAAAVLVHTASMLLVAGIIAFAFFEAYEKTGLRLLQRAWFNFDLLWALALLIAGCAALLL
jgi:hypothetical protein